jgi:hypothetical protein
MVILRVSIRPRDSSTFSNKPEVQNTKRGHPQNSFMHTRLLDSCKLLSCEAFN